MALSPAGLLTIFQTLMPSPAEWAGLGATLAVTAAFAVVGRATMSKPALPGLSVLAGWAVVAFVMTTAGVFSSWPIAVAGGAVVALGAAGVVGRAARTGIDGPAPELLRVFALGVPFLVIAAAKAPTAVDSFTHWLPNGAYLFQHDLFPGPGRPAATSIYPGFPYNLTFLFDLVGRVAGGFFASTVIVFNVVLLLMFAALVARLIRDFAAPGARAGWGVAALAVLAATLFNPVFVRRIWLNSYPDTATAVIVAFAGICGWLWAESAGPEARAGRAQATALGLVLALLVNVKQANLVLVAALALGPGLIAWRDERIGLGRWLRHLPLIAGPALVLYALWSYYLIAVAPLHVNEIRPIATWPWHKVPHLLGEMAYVATHKGGYFALAILLTGLGVRALYRRPRGGFDRLAVISGTAFVVYNLFLFFIYIAHFQGNAQSYWRYNIHLGFLATAVAACGLAAAYGRWRDRLPRRWVGYAASALVVLVPTAELAYARYWRFDLEQPKPMLREAGRDLARALPPDARLVVGIPGDNGDFSWIVHYYATVNRPDIAAQEAQSARQIVAAGHGALAQVPFFLWAYCGGPWLEQGLGISVPPGRAALIARRGAGWTLDRTWPHPVATGLETYSKHLDALKCGGR